MNIFQYLAYNIFRFVALSYDQRRSPEERAKTSGAKAQSLKL